MSTLNYQYKISCLRKKRKLQSKSAVRRLRSQDDGDCSWKHGDSTETHLVSWEAGLVGTRLRVKRLALSNDLRDSESRRGPGLSLFRLDWSTCDWSDNRAVLLLVIYTWCCICSRFVETFLFWVLIHQKKRDLPIRKPAPFSSTVQLGVYMAVLLCSFPSFPAGTLRCWRYDEMMRCLFVCLCVQQIMQQLLLLPCRLEFPVWIPFVLI